MATVELLYFPDCPNVPAARAQLRRALGEVGAAASWTEVDVMAPDAPARVRGFGSPTVLVDGRDVMGLPPSDGSSCRLYAGSEVPGVPPLAAIVAALRASPSHPDARRTAGFAIVPGTLISVLPVLSCPSCWPAYAGLMGSIGTPFLMEAAWLLPLTVGALILALWGLGFRASRRRGLAPMALGVVASAAILLGKFVWELDALNYVGTALLIGASIWNGWPRKQTADCDACTTTMRASAP